MSIPCKFERSILSYDEQERTLARENRRAVRGKGESRGGSFPGTAEHPVQRKQVFAAALKRVSKEIGRMQKLDARTEHIEAARRALAMRRAASFPPRPATGDTAGEGMRPSRNQRRRTKVPPATIGSASRSRHPQQGVSSVKLGSAVDPRAS
jgi:hypothetical protein